MTESRESYRMYAAEVDLLFSWGTAWQIHSSPKTTCQPCEAVSRLSGHTSHWMIDIVIAYFPTCQPEVCFHV